MSSVKSFFGRFRAATILVIFVVFCIVMWIASPTFMTWGNISTTFIAMCTTVLLVIGQTVVMAAGGIDLSVGSNMAISGAVTGYLFVKVGGVDIWVAVLCGILAAGIIGVLNGLILSRTNIAPMICTLGTMNLSAGLAMILTSGSPISMQDTPKAFEAIGRNIGPIPTLILIALIFIIIFAVLMMKSTIFRKTYYVGSNEQAAEFSSINVSRVKMGIYILSAVLSGIAGVMTTSRFSVASPNVGTGAEMTAISACVIGGASMNGGTGTIIGSILGLLLLTFINNALVLLNVSVYWQKMISGCILLLAVLVDYISHRTRK